VALLDAQPRGEELLLVLDGLQLQVLARLQDVGLRKREERLVLPDLLLERGGVEEDEEVPLPDELPSGARATIFAWLLWIVEA
jgi:hypothetical protein